MEAYNTSYWRDTTWLFTLLEITRKARIYQIGTHDEYPQWTFQIHDINTTIILTEAKTTTKDAIPVVLFLPEYSLTTITIITIGSLGTIELGVSSLVGFTANATGYAVYYGLITSLNTICAQSYVSSTKHLTFVYLQQMTLCRPW